MCGTCDSVIYRTVDTDLAEYTESLEDETQPAFIEHMRKVNSLEDQVNRGISRNKTMLGGDAKNPLLANPKRQKLQAVEAQAFKKKLNLGVFWPMTLWNSPEHMKFHPDEPLLKTQCRTYTGIGFGAIKDKKYGEPPGTTTLENENSATSELRTWAPTKSP